MIKYILVSLFVVIAAAGAHGQAPKDAPGLTRVEGKPERGFSYAYYLYVPAEITTGPDADAVRSLLVIPNNTGTINDDIAVHDEDVKRKMSQIGPHLNMAGLRVPVLMPVFPRPATEHRLYTHSLDRDTLTTDKKEFSRLDLQLLAMIKDARERLATQKIGTEEKVLMQGYSASGMFVNRFVFLHPEAVKAAAIGAPGGWAIAPVGEYGGRSLTYPAGIADLKEISGREFDLEALRKVPILMILGGADTNDAVPMGDAYDKRESESVIALFGKTPVERFPLSKDLYQKAGLNAEFKLYRDTSHQMSREMREDQIAFLKRFALP